MDIVELANELVQSVMAFSVAQELFVTEIISKGQIEGIFHIILKSTGKKPKLYFAFICRMSLITDAGQLIPLFLGHKNGYIFIKYGWPLENGAVEGMFQK